MPISSNDLLIIINNIQKKYPIKVDLRLISKKALTGSGGEIAILAFLLGSIGGGFLAEIGKDLWTKVKVLCKKIYTSLKDSGRGSNGVIFVECEYINIQVVATMEIKDNNIDNWNKIYNGDVMEYYWLELPYQLKGIIEAVDDKEYNIENTASIKLTLAIERAAWIISSAKTRIDTSKYLEKMLK